MALPIEKIDSALSEASLPTKSLEDAQKIWMCNASRASLRPDGSEWCKDVMDGTSMPYPCKQECFEPLEWPHVLSTFDIYVNLKPIKFCTLEGYDIQPFLMIISTYRWLDNQIKEPQFYCQDQVFVEDTPLIIYSLAKDGDHVDWFHFSDIDGENDFVVLESKLEKVCLLLESREAKSMSIPRDQPQRKFCQSHHKFCKQIPKEKESQIKS